MKRFAKVKRGLALAAALCMALLLPLTALASVPDRPENQYVLDEADVLSDKTEREIISENQKLFEKTGAEIVVVAVDFLGGEEIDDYAYELFDNWGIGSSERNNGLLLVLAVGEEDYYVLPGYGIEETFSGGELQSMLDAYLEPDFAAGNYDAGVQKFFGEALDRMNSLEYDDDYGNTDGYDGNYNYEENGEYESYSVPTFFQRVIRTLVRIVFAIIVIAVIVILIVSLSGGSRGGPGGPGGGGGFWRGMFWGSMLGRRRRGGWYSPPPPPPGGFGPGPGPGPRPPRGGGGFGGLGGFSGGGRSGGFGGSRGGFSGGGRSGGFHGGGGSRGGGAGRR